MIETNDEVITEPKHVADVMNNFYVNIAAHIGADVTVPTLDSDISDYISRSILQFSNHPCIVTINESFSKSNDFCFKPITFSEMSNALSKLDASKAIGYDGIPPKVLKLSCTVLDIPLTNLFNGCIVKGVFPSQMKYANVIPVFKKDNPLVKKNYRPVSILTSVSKAFERLIAQQLTYFQNDIFHPLISAFRRQHSCQSVLMRLTEDWHAALDNGMYVGTVLMDLSKASNSMPF